ncbi:MAG: hypothetical protein R3299_04755 [Arenibacter sp.]|uniref:Rieske (2Fe-2S) protein n=1 Tax=Arenibacter TaxID=178469 RepID=UPI000A3B25EF|nr:MULTISPECIES: hypothetical protein [Arenibacter]MDX1326994.1 hypothetical protein [Arenibacter sp.]
MKPILGLLALAIFLSCDSSHTNRNPYLQEVSFRYSINLNLPLYSSLIHTGNAVYLDNPGVGTRGIFVINTGFDNYMAWEASCPNHAPNNCSTMSLKGQTVSCSCEGFEYNLFTGQLLNRPDDGTRHYDLLFYRATVSGNTIFVSN